MESNCSLFVGYSCDNIKSLMTLNVKHSVVHMRTVQERSLELVCTVLGVPAMCLQYTE